MLLLKPYFSDPGYKFVRVQWKASGMNGSSVYLQKARERLTMVCIKRTALDATGGRIELNSLEVALCRSVGKSFRRKS
ncbi:hypothetical protein HFO02_36015 [Rhizobium laguerreae]|uniref:hypothetical protein n=1 Tax=Rhizobium laguerreae TaxID=1076926 RepID=UPI001C8FF04B|nr:hypothetical protein [Rhizobium laguerreae]MBY3328886.1 hypothetical protein [Rhizobium laguerreae]